MKKSTDYNLSGLQQITTAGTNVDLYITPRFKNHYISQEYEPFSISFLDALLTNKQCFVDIGSHYGYYSVMASKYHPGIKIVAVEPVKENYEILKKNFALNKIKNHQIYNSPASDKSCFVNFNLTEASDSAGIYTHPLTKTIRTIKMKTIVPDILLNDTKNIGLIKIDVEGHEVNVLNGLSETIRKNPRLKIIVEFNPKCQIAAGRDPNELINKIDELGFEQFIINESNNTICRLTGNKQHWSEFIPPQSYVNLLCIPKKISCLTIYVTHSSELGGAEKSLLELLKVNRKMALLSHVIVPSSTGQFVDKLRGLNIPFSTLNYCWWAGISQKVPTEKISESTKNVLDFIPKIEAINPHNVYTNTSVIPWGAIIASKLALPHVWHINEFIKKDHNLITNISIKDIALFIEKTSSFVVFNSKSTQRYFTKYFNNKLSKNDVYYYDIELPKPKNIVNPFMIKDSLKLIMVGGIQKGKRQDQAIRAVNILQQRHYSVELLIVGSSNKNSTYYRKIYNLTKKSRNIYLHDSVDNPQDFMNLADVVLICSQNEAFGRTTFEGMKLKKMVIGSKSGGTPELIADNKTGFLYDPSSTTELVNKLMKVLKKPSLINLFGERGYKRYMDLSSQNKKRIKDQHSLLEHRVLKHKNSTTSFFVDFLESLSSRTPQNTSDILENFKSETEKKYASLIEEFKKEYDLKLAEIISINTNLSNENLTISNRVKEIETSKYFKLYPLYEKIKSIVKSITSKYGKK